MDELLLGVDGEVVDSHLVGLSQVGVVGFDFGEVVLEYEFPVLLLFVLEALAVCGFEVLPGVDVLATLVADVQSQSRENQKCNYSCSDHCLNFLKYY